MLRKKNDLAFIIFIATAWFLVFLIKPAYAYLDPGSGSMILQILLGGYLKIILASFYEAFGYSQGENRGFKKRKDCR